MTFNEQGFSP